MRKTECLFSEQEINVLTIFLNATEDVIDIIGEESLCIQHSLNEACDGTKGHVFCMRVPVPLEEGRGSGLHATRHDRERGSNLPRAAASLS